MKRRNFLKAFLAAPFAGLLKKTPKASGGGSSGPSISPSSSVSSSTSCASEGMPMCSTPSPYLDAMDVPDEEWQRNYDRVMYIHYTDGHPSYRVNFIGMKRQK